MIVKLEDRDVRRLGVILKLKEEVLILSSSNEITFLVEIGNIFKSVTFMSPTTEDKFIKISSDLIQCVLMGEGVLKLDVDENNTVMVAYAKSKEDLANQKMQAISGGTVRVFNRREVNDYMNLLKASRTKELEAFNLNNIKDLIKVCALTESGISISDGYAFSLNENIIIFSQVGDKSIRAGYTINALKEIEKFKTKDALTTQSLNYTLLRREDFVLGLVKANVTSKLNDFVPSMYMNDENALANYYVDFTFLGNQNYINRKSLNDSGEDLLQIDLTKGFVTSVLDSKNFIYKIDKKLISQSIDKLGKQQLKFSLRSIDKMKSLLNGETIVKLSVYPTNTRISLQKQNMGIIIRSEFE